MREVEGLLSWLAVTDLENLERREAYTLVGKALEELENETSEQQDEDLLDEAFDLLQEIQQILLKGDLPTGKLVDFYQRFDPAFRSPLECSAGELDAELVGRLERGLLDLPPMEVAATELRPRLARGEDPGPLLGAGVFDYVRAHGLYAEAR